MQNLRPGLMLHFSGKAFSCEYVFISGVKLSFKMRQKQYFVSSSETVLHERPVLFTENKAVISSYLVALQREDWFNLLCSCEN